MLFLPMRRLSNYLCGAEQKPSEALGNTHTCVLPLPRRPYRRCGLFVCGSSPYRHSERSVGIQRSESKSSACVHSTQIAIYHLRQRRKYQASDIAKLRLEFLSLLELIACIGCAVAEQKPSEALGNTHTCVLPLPRRRFLLTLLQVCVFCR